MPIEISTDLPDYRSRKTGFQTLFGGPELGQRTMNIKGASKVHR